jgi:hypothetical protein
VSRRVRATRHRGRKRGLTPATLLMWIIVAGMLVMLVATRWTLDYTGETLAIWLNEFAEWWRGNAR